MCQYNYRNVLWYPDRFITAENKTGLLELALQQVNQRWHWRCCTTSRCTLVRDQRQILSRRSSAVWSYWPNFIFSVLGASRPDIPDIEYSSGLSTSWLLYVCSNPQICGKASHRLYIHLSQSWCAFVNLQSCLAFLSVSARSNSHLLYAVAPASSSRSNTIHIFFGITLAICYNSPNILHLQRQPVGAQLPPIGCFVPRLIFVKMRD